MAANEVKNAERTEPREGDTTSERAAMMEEASVVRVAAGGAWASLPPHVLVRVLTGLGLRELLAVRLACRSFYAAEDASWHTLRRLRPRAWLPAFLGPDSAGAAQLRLHSLADVGRALGRVGARLVDGAARSLDLARPPASGQPVLVAGPVDVRRFMDAFGAALERVESLRLEHCLFAHADLVAWGQGLPNVRRLALTSALFLPLSPPPALALLQRAPVGPSASLFAPPRRRHLIAAFHKPHWSPAALDALSDAQFLLLHSALTAFPRLQIIQFYP